MCSAAHRSSHPGINNFNKTKLTMNIMMTPLFIGGLGMQEVLLIALVVLLFFGGKKIPELMKGLGKGVRSFREGMNNMEKEIEEEPVKKE